MNERLASIFFLKNGPSPASFSFIFGLFQTNIKYNFTRSAKILADKKDEWRMRKKEN